jgi:hypothetical protein
MEVGHILDLPALGVETAVTRTLYHHDGVFRSLQDDGLGEFLVVRQGLHELYSGLFNTIREEVAALRDNPTGGMRTFTNRPGTYSITYRAPTVSPRALRVAKDKAYNHYHQQWGDTGKGLGIGEHSALSNGDTSETPDWLRPLTEHAHTTFFQAMREEGTR